MCKEVEKILFSGSHPHIVQVGNGSIATGRNGQRERAALESDRNAPWEPHASALRLTMRTRCISSHMQMVPPMKVPVQYAFNIFIMLTTLPFPYLRPPFLSPRAVQYYESFASGPYLYIAMELVEGTSLLDFLQVGL